nr:50S ribosomal protein L34e [Candidatus Sigynarchaeota archaeon]
MPSGKYRSRSFTRKRTRLPGKKNVIHYARRKPSRAQCGSCGEYLNGVPRIRDAKRKNLSKSGKRPERPFGGTLCPRCLKLAIQKATFGSK